MKDHMARKAIDELADQLGYKKMNYYESIESVDIYPDYDNFDKCPVTIGRFNKLAGQFEALKDYLEVEIGRREKAEYEVKKIKGRNNKK